MNNYEHFTKDPADRLRSLTRETYACSQSQTKRCLKNSGLLLACSTNQTRSKRVQTRIIMKHREVCSQCSSETNLRITNRSHLTAGASNFPTSFHVHPPQRARSGHTSKQNKSIVQINIFTKKTCLVNKFLI
jgi:hypothetical protein